MRPSGTTTMLFGAALTALAAAFATTTAATTSAPGGPVSAPARVARGEYLVNAMGCHDCHTPWKMGPKGPEPDMSRALTGHPASVVMPRPPALPPAGWNWAGAETNTAFAGPWGVSFTANLTPDVETGLGAWTEEMFIATMKTGRHQGKGRPLLPPMPYPNVGGLNDEDIRSVFAYSALAGASPQSCAGADRSGRGWTVMRAGRAVTTVAILLAAVAAGASSRRALASGPADEPVAPPRLADTGLYADSRLEIVHERNRPFSPQYPLWTDGAVKSRWVYMPAGATIDVTDPYDWNFPVGTRFWKEFRFKDRKIETRMLWKASDDRWVAASYHWNDAQTDAVLAPAAGIDGVVEVRDGRRHSIPSRTDCSACHGDRTKPLGFTALQLSSDRDPNAIHGEPLRSGMVTLRTLAEGGLLTPARQELMAPPRIVTADAQTRSLLGYLSANCGSCHNGAGDIAALGPVIDVRELLRDGDAVARRFLNQATRWQVPGVADGASVLVNPSAVSESAMLARMRSRRPSSQMPPLGSVVPDQEAIEVLTRWIAARAHPHGPAEGR